MVTTRACTHALTGGGALSPETFPLEGPMMLVASAAALAVP